MIVPELAPWPAHLHIDLLPEWQGRGYGRQLMRTFLEALRDGGVPSVHLVMATANKPARAFYDRMGFEEIDRCVVEKALSAYEAHRPTKARLVVQGVNDRRQRHRHGGRDSRV